MTAIAVAIERKQWEVVSLQLLLGISVAAAKLPAESLTELIDLVSGGNLGSPGRDSGR